MKKRFLNSSQLWLATCLLAAANAQGGIVVINDTIGSVPGSFAYNYVFTSALDPTFGAPSDRMEGSGPNQAFATLYDIPGFISATLNPAFSSVLALTVQSIGLTPPSTIPLDTALTNITLRYTGPTLTADTVFMRAVSITSSFTALNTQGVFSGLDTKNVGPLSGTGISSVGSVAVPGSNTPEPPTLGLLVFALAGLGFFKRARAI